MAFGGTDRKDPIDAEFRMDRVHGQNNLGLPIPVACAPATPFVFVCGSVALS
jgi:hypothetical protein